MQSVVVSLWFMGCALFTSEGFTIWKSPLYGHGHYHWFAINWTFLFMFSTFLKWATKRHMGSGHVRHYGNNVLFVGKAREKTESKILLDEFGSLTA